MPSIQAINLEASQAARARWVPRPPTYFYTATLILISIGAYPEQAPGWTRRSRSIIPIGPLLDPYWTLTGHDLHHPVGRAYPDQVKHAGPHAVRYLSSPYSRKLQGLKSLHCPAYVNDLVSETVPDVPSCSYNPGPCDSIVKLAMSKPPHSYCPILLLCRVYQPRLVLDVRSLYRSIRTLDSYDWPCSSV